MVYTNYTNCPPLSTIVLHVVFYEGKLSLRIDIHDVVMCVPFLLGALCTTFSFQPLLTAPTHRAPPHPAAPRLLSSALPSPVWTGWSGTIRGAGGVSRSSQVMKLIP